MPCLILLRTRVVCLTEGDLQGCPPWWAGRQAAGWHGARGSCRKHQVSRRLVRSQAGTGAVRAEQEPGAIPGSCRVAPASPPLLGTGSPGTGRSVGKGRGAELSAGLGTVPGPLIIVGRQLLPTSAPAWELRGAAVSRSSALLAGPGTWNKGCKH